jgi:hypothetical protein
MKKVLITLAALALSGTAMAGPSWTYVDLGYITGDSGDESTDGVGLRGSFGFGEIWHVEAGYADIDRMGGKSKGGEDVSAYYIRGGIHPALTDNTDFVADIAYGVSDDDDGSSDNPEPDAFQLRTGVRSNIGNVELRSFISLAFGSEDTGGDDDFRSVNYSVGGQYNFSDAWSVGADATVGDFADEIDLYVRWSF